jgi:hypothetical protein
VAPVLLLLPLALLVLPLLLLLALRGLPLLSSTCLLLSFAASAVFGPLSTVTFSSIGSAQAGVAAAAAVAWSSTRTRRLVVEANDPNEEKVADTSKRSGPALAATSVGLLAGLLLLLAGFCGEAVDFAPFFDLVDEAGEGAFLSWLGGAAAGCPVSLGGWPAALAAALFAALVEPLPGLLVSAAGAEVGAVAGREAAAVVEVGVSVFVVVACSWAIGAIALRAAAATPKEPGLCFLGVEGLEAGLGEGGLLFGPGAALGAFLASADLGPALAAATEVEVAGAGAGAALLSGFCFFLGVEGLEAGLVAVGLVLPWAEFG